MKNRSEILDKKENRELNLLRSKKGAEASTGIGKLITLILVVVVLVVVIIGLLGLDVHGFFSNLPDFIKNLGKSPTDLLEDAVIYGIPVKILLNDGFGRCIVYETYNFQGQDDSWLKNYGVKGYVLLMKNGGWEGADKTGIDRLTQDMIKNKELPKDLIEKEKELVVAVNVALKSAQLCTSDPLMRVNPPLIPPTVSSIGSIFTYSDGEVNDLCVWSEGKFFNLPEFVKHYIEDKGWKLRLICDEKPTQRIAEGCILQSTENENYAFESGNLYAWYDYSTAMRLFGAILDSSYKGIWKKWDGTNFKNQIIRQDLYKECYLDEKKFKNAVVLGKNVKLLKRDAEKRCIIYESNDDFSLEHYGITRTVEFGGLRTIFRLNRLNETGGWEDIDNQFPNEDQIKEAEIALQLIETEKKFAKYLGGFSVQICKDIDGNDCISDDNPNLKGLKIILQSMDSGGGIGRSLKMLSQYSFRGYDFILYSNFRENINKKSRIYILNYYFSNYGNDYSWICPEKDDICYVRREVDGRIYASSDYSLYKLDGGSYKKLEKKDYPFLYKSQKELDDLIKSRNIKEELKKQC